MSALILIGDKDRGAIAHRDRALVDTLLSRQASSDSFFVRSAKEQIAITRVKAGMSTDPKTADLSVPSNAEKAPDDWTTGDESMTGAQASYLKTLCEEAGEQFDPNLTKANASKMIDALQGKTGRGRTH